MKTRFLDTVQSSHLFQLLILGMLLFFMPGCAVVKDTVRNTHSALMTIALLTELDESGETEEEDQLYLFGEEITDACEPLLTSTGLKVDGEEIPLMLLLETLFSILNCHNTVDATRQKLSAMNLTVNQW